LTRHKVEDKSSWRADQGRGGDRGVAGKDAHISGEVCFKGPYFGTLASKKKGKSQLR